MHCYESRRHSYSRTLRCIRKEPSFHLGIYSAGPPSHCMYSEKLQPKPFQSITCMLVRATSLHSSQSLILNQSLKSGFATKSLPPPNPPIVFDLSSTLPLRLRSSLVFSTSLVEVGPFICPTLPKLASSSEELPLP